MSVTEVRTANGQTIRVGTQVAYATPLRAIIRDCPSLEDIKITGGKLFVSTVVEIVQITEAWEFADASFGLKLKNGEVVTEDKVCVTDGQFCFDGKPA